MLCRNISPSIVEPDLACATITIPTGDAAVVVVVFPAVEEEPPCSDRVGMSLAATVVPTENSGSSSGSSSAPRQNKANSLLVVHASITERARYSSSSGSSSRCAQGVVQGYTKAGKTLLMLVLVLALALWCWCCSPCRDEPAGRGNQRKDKNDPQQCYCSSLPRSLNEKQTAATGFLDKMTKNEFRVSYLCVLLGLSIPSPPV